jgi:chromosome segregation ATPase
MQDSNDERSDLTTSLMELEVDFHALWQQNVEWADQMSLDIEALKETKAELSGFVDELKGEILSLQKSEEVLALTFAEIERKATDEVNARLQTERQSQSLASELQDVEMELGKLKDEHANAGEKLEKSVLERHMLEEGFKELQDAYTQLIQDKAALETLSWEVKAQHDMNLEHLKLEAEECNQKLNLLEEQRTLLQQEKESIFLDFTIFRSDVEKRMMESDAVVAKLNDDHAVFQTNLQAAVCRTFPDTEGKQQDVVGTSFESCWKLVNLLVDKSMQLVGLQTQLQEAAVEEKAQYAATLQAMEAKNDVLKQTNKELSSKVQILASEVEQAAGEEERLRQSLTSNMLEIHNLQTEKQDLLAVQDSEVKGLKQQLEEVTLRSVQQDEQLRNLMQQKQTLEADISKARGDHSAAQTEIVQMEKKLSNTKERLTLAISKGKSVVQQRDAVKQALKEKTEDLEHLISSHAEVGI